MYNEMNTFIRGFIYMKLSKFYPTDGFHSGSLSSEHYNKMAIQVGGAYA